MFELISKLSFSRGFNILLILFGAVSGPFFFLYRFYHPLYLSNSLSKILLLSAAIGVPVVLSMSFINAITIGLPKIKEQDVKTEFELSIIGLTSGFCGFIFYGACFADWFIGGITAREGIELMLFTYAGALSYSIFRAIQSKFKKKGK